METNDKKQNNLSFEDRLIDLHSRMFSFALTLTSNKDKAGDLLQESILKVLNNKNKYYENVNFNGWVFTIIYNIFLNNYRRSQRSNIILDHTEEQYYLNLHHNAASQSPESTYTYSEIINAINSFSEEYKLPFVMHIKGYKYDEISITLSLPLGTVKSRIFFARKRLQEILADYRHNN